jgi:hypothetical protein
MKAKTKIVICPETGWGLVTRGDAPEVLGVSATTVWRLPADSFDGRFVILWKAKAALKARKKGRPRNPRNLLVKELMGVAL